MILNNDIISRAAIKQINCHAHRAKNIQLSSVPSPPPRLSELKLKLPESRYLDPRRPPAQSCWQVLQYSTPSPPHPPSRGRGLQQPWCLVYRSRYGNMSYTIKLFSILKNKWLNGICLSAKCFPLCIQGYLFPRVCRSFRSSSLAIVLALSYIASSTYDDNTCPKFVALAWSWCSAKTEESAARCKTSRSIPSIHNVLRSPLLRGAV